MVNLFSSFVFPLFGIQIVDEWYGEDGNKDSKDKPIEKQRVLLSACDDTIFV